METKMTDSGQALIEFSLVSLLIILPFAIGAFTWYQLMWDKTRCSNDAFFLARAKLIQTHQPVNEVKECGSITQSIGLSSLEDLDHNKGSLGINDGMKEVSQLLESASRLRSSLRPSDSSK